MTTMTINRNPLAPRPFDALRVALRNSNGRQARGGFTLIEMLVVVAVIGILSSVLLTGLGPARDKAKDSRIVTEVNQARAIAATLDNGGYSALPTADENGQNDLSPESYPELAQLENDILAQGGELAIIKSEGPYFRAFLMYSKLNIQAGTPPAVESNYYCIDSIGRSGFFVSLPGRLAVDPSNPETVRCPLPF